MNATVLWLTALGVILMCGMFWLLNELTKFKQRTISEVPDFLRSLDGRVTAELFNLGMEQEQRQQRAPRNFRRDQRIGLDLAREYYLRQYHNVRIQRQWSTTESNFIRRFNTQDEYTEARLEKMEQVRRQSRKFCQLAVLVLAKIWILSLLMSLDKFCLLPTPGVAALSKIGPVDMLGLYREIKAAAAEFAKTYGDEKSQAILSRM